MSDLLISGGVLAPALGGVLGGLALAGSAAVALQIATGPRGRTDTSCRRCAASSGQVRANATPSCCVPSSLGEPMTMRDRVCGKPKGDRIFSTGILLGGAPCGRGRRSERRLRRTLRRRDKAAR